MPGSEPGGVGSIPTPAARINMGSWSNRKTSVLQTEDPGAIPGGSTFRSSEHGQVVQSVDTRHSKRRAFGYGSSTLPLAIFRGAVRKQAKRRSLNLRDSMGSTPICAIASKDKRTARSSSGSGCWPLKPATRVRIPHGSIFAQRNRIRPSGATGRHAALRTPCPSGLGVRISPWSLTTTRPSTQIPGKAARSRAW